MKQLKEKFFRNVLPILIFSTLFAAAAAMPAFVEEQKALELLPEELVPKQNVSAYSKTTVMAPMRDGVKLATDFYLPGGKKMKMPVVLMRTPYGKALGGIFATTILGKRMAWVVQDTRGRYDSEGISFSFLDDVNDGYDTIDWIAKQPWCNGEVGTIGISAMGITQYVMAVNPHPALKSQYVMAAAGSLYHDGAYMGGGFLRSLVIEWVGGNKFPVEFLEKLLQNPHYNFLWKAVNLHEYTAGINYPILHMAGWYDIFLTGNISAYEDVQKNGGPGARGKQYLVIGPWTHEGWCAIKGTDQGALIYPANSKYDVFKYSMKWFEDTLKGGKSGYYGDQKVRYYMMGDPEDPNAPGNEWRTADDWPPPFEPVPYYFNIGGRLTPEKPKGPVHIYKGEIQAEEGHFPASLGFIMDPANPVRTIGGANLSIPHPGPADQRESEKRSDVLTFTTDILAEPLEIIGPLKAVLYVSTDAPDTDFVVKLTDVYPDGRSMLVADGILRASYREGYIESAAPLEPGRIYELTVDVTYTGLVFNKGHKIRVSVAGSNFPRYDINQNNGKIFDLSEGELADAVKTNLGKYVDTPDLSPDFRTAHNKLYADFSYPSHFILPVAKH